ncbi:hypothetical protein MOZ60_03845 [Stecheria sp. CLA-KB-P133]|uniref:Uncharacterized protein n=1 Tax=Grylomicrobium aquisgranensis TaxID=2926318 RepID=A0AB35U2E1_9FIRM|nr:hypothetical protein [Stecheria sp. CLA-KB-P133]
MTTAVKRICSIFLTTVTAFSLAACGGKPSAGTGSAKPTAGTAEGTKASTALFSLSYTDDWALDEDKTNDSSDYCYMELTIPQNNTALVTVEIKASVDSAGSYRDRLKGSGIDAYELVEKQSVETTNIGGVECVEYESEYWGSSTLTYLGRDEPSSTTVFVSISGDQEDSRVKDLIKSLQFTLTDIDNTDAPWPWNGEPFSTDVQHTYSAGDHTITADWLKLDDPLLVSDLFSGRVEVTGDTVWVLLDNTLYQYQYSDNALTFIDKQDLTDKGDYEELSADSSGKLYVSGFMEPMLVMENGEVTGQYEDVDSAVIHPDGNWGLSAFVGRPLRKISLNGETAQIEEWALRSSAETDRAFLSQNHIYVSGTSDDKGQETVWVFDTAGNQQFEFGNVEFSENGSLGSITDVVETANGFIAFDGNMRSILFYGGDGNLLATADDEELFGTSYPWISSAAVMPDGSVLVALSEGRADDSADELLLYRLSGF